jgi:hypothetical protein
VAAAADAEGRVEQRFLDVVADRAARHAAEVCELVNPEAPLFLVHATQYRQ